MGDSHEAQSPRPACLPLISGLFTHCSEWDISFLPVGCRHSWPRAPPASEDNFSKQLGFQSLFKAVGGRCCLVMYGIPSPSNRLGYPR